MKHHGMTQDMLASSCDMNVSTAGRWCRDGIPANAHSGNVQAFYELESDLPPEPVDSEIRARISGALPDLSAADLEELLVEVKRRQLAALATEFGQQGEAAARSAARSAATRAVAAGKKRRQKPGSAG